MIAMNDSASIQNGGNVADMDEVARRGFQALLHAAENEFDVSFGLKGYWRYANTHEETGSRRDALFVEDDATKDWTVRVNDYVGEGALICDDAKWEAGLVLGAGHGWSYEEAITRGLHWLSTGILEKAYMDSNTLSSSARDRLAKQAFLMR